MTFTELFRSTVAKLTQAGVENPEVDTRLLVESCFGLTMSSLVLSGDRIVDPETLIDFNILVQRRQNREPLQYILGKCEFWSLEFLVTPAVLIPRQETEFLLYQVLETVTEQNLECHPLLDMCTGSGVIAIVLAHELAVPKIVAIDKSLEALHIAQKNISQNNKKNVVELVCSDLFEGIQPTRRFGTLISNPPYIADRDMATLQAEVRDWEPELALKAGELGLDIILKILHQAPLYVVPSGWIFLEIGAEQGKDVHKLFSESNHISGKKLYKQVEIIDDWSGRARVLRAQLNC